MSSGRSPLGRNGTRTTRQRVTTTYHLPRDEVANGIGYTRRTTTATSRHEHNQTDFDIPVSGEYGEEYADGDVTRDCQTGQSSAALRLCEELAQTLRERCRQLNRAAMTAKTSMATTSIDTDTMLSAAKAEAEAWKHSKSKLASVKSAQHLSPLGIRAIISERDELRHQLQRTAAELAKFHSLTGGVDLSIEGYCQEDLDKIAALKSQIDFETNQAYSRIRMLEEQTTENGAARRQIDLQIATYERQLAEQLEHIHHLESTVTTTTQELEEVRRAAQRQLNTELAKQRDRLSAQAAETKEGALEHLESSMRTEMMQRLEDQRAELEARHSEQMESALAQQRQVLMSQGDQGKLEALQALQTDMNHEHSAELERFRKDLLAQKESAIRTLRRQHEAVLKRLEQEMEHQRQELDAQRIREVDELRRSMQLEARDELQSALAKQKRTLEEDHKGAMHRLRTQLESQNKTLSEAKLQRELDRQRKQLQSQAARSQQVAVNNLKRELTEKHKLDVKTSSSSAATRQRHQKDKELQIKMEAERKKLGAQAEREKMQQMEELRAQMNAEKHDALAQQRTKIEMRFSAELESLREELLEAKKSAAKLRTQTHLTAEQLNARESSTKTSRRLLREKLRTILSRFKSVVLPHSDALVDVSGGMPTQAMADLNSLISGLAHNTYDQLGEPSNAAEGAPGQTVDVLLICVDELLEYFASVTQEIQSLQVQLQRDRKLVRKKVEEELAAERAAELEAQRVQLTKDFEGRMVKRIAETKQLYDAELERERRDMDHELREVQAQSAAQQRQVSAALHQKLEEEKMGMTQQLKTQLVAQKTDTSRVTALERQVSKYQKELQSCEATITQLRQETTSLRATIVEMRRSQHKKQDDAGLSTDVRTLALEKRQAEKERMALERQVATFKGNGRA
eukprot:m.35209 g.35209  ORF g.35209 m.35209 type:complete len:915 (+) comp9864_c0_seq1:151-2895(+)